MVHKIIWLDDVRDPNAKYRGSGEETYIEHYANMVGIDLRYSDVVWATNGDMFKEAVRDCFPTLICFDHDLGEDSISGMDCFNWLIEFYIDHYEALPYFPKCVSQSDNPVGRENILTKYNNFIKHWND